MSSMFQPTQVGTLDENNMQVDTTTPNMQAAVFHTKNGRYIEEMISLSSADRLDQIRQLENRLIMIEAEKQDIKDGVLPLKVRKRSEAAKATSKEDLDPKRLRMLAANSASSEKVRVNQNLKLLKTLSNHDCLMARLQELQACTNEYMQKQFQLRQERAELLQKFNEFELKLLYKRAEFDKLNKEKEELMAMEAMAEVQNMQALDEVEQYFAMELQ